MLRVIMPNGTVLQYNDAYFLECNDNGRRLYSTSYKKEWIVTVPLDCIVEAVEPCKVTSIFHHNSDQKKIAELQKKIKNLQRQLRRRK